MVNRRRFVRTAAAAVVAAALPAFAAPASAARRKKRKKRKKNLTAKWWLRRRNTRAVLQGDEWHVVEVAEVHEHHASEELEQFTISFRCSPGDEVSEGTYKVKVKGGRVKLHVQPAGSDESGSYCVASVSRLI